ncbi:hypothetical protein [Nonomuraea sp. NPDC050783]|uniref:hypothetical protein n=1 Tax=Nonomuraea sp. NPDC050783 TaxID=3154634 RepID=UPI003467320F
MRKKIERARGRVPARALMLAGGAAAVVAAVVAVGAGSVTSAGQRHPSPQVTDARREVVRDGAPAAPQPGSMPGTSIAAPGPAPAAQPRGRAAHRDDQAGDTKPVGAAGDRARADEPAGRRELVPPRRPAGAASGRHPSRPAPRARRGPGNPSPHSPTPLGRDQDSSLLGMKCDELFPLRRWESRVRNVACHHLLG